MSPPVPGTLWRQQASDDYGDKPIVIDGHVIPRGTYVGVNTYALHHNEVSRLASCHFLFGTGSRQQGYITAWSD